MGHSERGRLTYLIEARQGLIGAASVGIVGLALGGLGALPAPLAVLLVALSIGAGTFAARRTRRRQAEMALVLRDSSASGSARKAIELVRRLLTDGAHFEFVVGTMDILTARRRHPHTAMLARVRAVLDTSNPQQAEPDSMRRRRAIAACDEALRKQIISRNQTIHALASMLNELAATVDVVLLYGYSSIACEGVVASPQIRARPIWVVQDLQYGGASINEHREVKEMLHSHGVRAEVIAYDDVFAVLGHVHAPFVRTTEFRLLPLMNQRRVLAIIGCEAFDGDGNVLIPAQVEGVPSETARFAELASTTASEGVHPRLLVAGESIKRVDSCHLLETRTQVPLPTSWWRKPLHSLGVVIPFSGRDVQLIQANVGAHNVVSDSGPIALPPQPTLPVKAEIAETTRLGSLNLDEYSAVVIDLDSALTDTRIVAYERLAELVDARGLKKLHFSTYQTMCRGLGDREAVAALVAGGLLPGPLKEATTHLDWLAHHPELDWPSQPTFVNGAHSFVARLRSRTNRVGVLTRRSRESSRGLLDTTFLGEILVSRDVMFDVEPTRAYRQFANLAWVGSDHTLPALFISRDDDVIALARTAGHQAMLLGPPESVSGDLRSLGAALVEGRTDPLNQLEMARPTADESTQLSTYSVLASAELDHDSEQQYLRLCRAGFPERSWDVDALRRRALSEHLVSVLTISDPQRVGVIAGVATLHEGTAPGEAKLHWVVVSPASRRTGVGRALTMFAISAAYHHGYTRITLTTEASRAHAISLYESCGFAQE